MRPRAATGGATVRVMTWNLHHGVGMDRRLDLERVARVIERARPDVVGLQEVDQRWSGRSDHVDQTAWLARRLGMRAVFEGARERVGREGSEPGRYGNALLAVAPLDDVQAIPLPPRDVRGPWPEPRVLLRARVSTGAGELVAGVTHLDPSDAHLRSLQAAAVAQAMQTVRGFLVLMGDMNADPASGEFAPLRDVGLTETEDDRRGTRSARARARVLPPRVRTFPAPFPLRQLDAVWGRDVTFERVAVPPVRVASDHRPLVVDVALGGTARDAGHRPAASRRRP